MLVTSIIVVIVILLLLMILASDTFCACTAHKLNCSVVVLIPVISDSSCACTAHNFNCTVVDVVDVPLIMVDWLNCDMMIDCLEFELLKGLIFKATEWNG